MTQTARGLDHPPASARLRRRIVGALAALALALVAVGAPLSASAEAGTGPGSISGVVSSSGVPLDGVTVEIFPVSGGDPQSQTTGVDGLYTFAGLDLGEYAIFVSAGPVYQFAVVDNATLSEAEPDVARNVSLEQVPTGNASLSGAVLDAGSGLGLAGASVSVWAPASGASAFATTDTDGLFTLSSLPGGETYYLSVDLYGFANVYQPVEIGVDENAVITIELVASNSGFVGAVLDRDGAAVADTRVKLTGANAGGEGLTDEFGSYAVSNLAPGTYTLTVGGSGTPWTLTSKTVTVAANEILTVNFTVTPRRTGEIRGYVLTADEWAIQNICTTVYKAGTSRIVAQGAPSSPEATFGIDNLKPGRYTLRFSDCDPDRSPRYASEWWQDSKRRSTSTVITIVAAQTVNIGQVTLALKPVHGRN